MLATETARAMRAVARTPRPAIASGIESAVLADAMPRIDPNPNAPRYSNPSAREGIVARMTSVSAPLPAKPCAAPTQNGRLPSARIE